MTVSTHIQFARFAIVGMLSNAVLYLLYLGFTELGGGHKLVMTVLYLMGVLQTFFFNKKWSFDHNGRARMVFVRYFLVYGIGYIINLLALIVLVDIYQFQHQVVQAVVILMLAVSLFIVQKYWVFRHDVQFVNEKEER